MAISAYHNSKETVIMWTGSNVEEDGFELINEECELVLSERYDIDSYREILKDFKVIEFEESNEVGLLIAALTPSLNERVKIGCLTIRKTSRVSYFALYTGPLTEKQKYLLATKIIEELPKIRARFDCVKRISDDNQAMPGILSTFGYIIEGNFSYLMSSVGGQVVKGPRDAFEQDIMNSISAKIEASSAVSETSSSWCVLS